MSPAELLLGFLDARLEQVSRDWIAAARAEFGGGVAPERFAALLSLASRHVPRGPLAPSAEERARAEALQPGWNPERWDRLDAARVILVLGLPDPGGLGTELFIEEAFRFADVGEAVACYRALPLLPDPGRFARRMGEGARSNMRALFEAACCDTPYPALHFDDVAWRSAVLKALFVGAPLWRIWGLDGRLDAEVARMALDFADERRSAGREVPAELWLCLGQHAGARGRAAWLRELEHGGAHGRAAAVLAAARAKDADSVRAQVAHEADPRVAAIMARALAGDCAARAFADLESL